MQRSILAAIAVTLFAGMAGAQTMLPPPPPMVMAAPPPPQVMGGGFIEFLFNGPAPGPRGHRSGPPAHPQQFYAPPDTRQVHRQGAAAPFYPPQGDPRYQAQRPPLPVFYDAGPPAPGVEPRYASTGPIDPMLERQPPGYRLDPQFQRQLVPYAGSEPPGTIVIDTPNHFLYLVQEGGTAMRYGIGVGRPGFTWSGEHAVTAKREWPDWVPPKEMLAREPHLPRFMPGGPNNPLGARALYLGSTLYRIHGSNEPWTIGANVSSGCIRMRNVDVIDLYTRVSVGTKVIVL